MRIELPTTPRGFVLARDVRAAGRQADLAAEVRQGGLELVRRGVYRRPAPEPAGWSPSRRAAAAYLRLVHASAETLRRPVYTSYSAIALHRLPIIGDWPPQVFVLAPGSHGFRRSLTIGIARLDDVALASVDGLVVTSIEHSLIQFCRHAPLIAALVAVEAAVASMPWDDAPPRTSLARLRAEHARLKPYPLSRKVEAVLSRATSLSGSPLETGSKLRFEEYGFPAPVQQQRFWLPEAQANAFVDFTWPAYGAMGEADGDGKYRSGSIDADGVQRLLDEKSRELELRRMAKAFDRWGWAQMWEGDTLARRVRALGLPGGTRTLRLF